MQETETNALIKTLTIQQLIERWSRYSRYTLENIYEIANKGCIGIYIRLGLNNKRSCHNIKEYLEHRITIAKLANNTNLQNHYIELQHDFYNILTSRPLLFEENLGYARLATAIEEKIFPACTTGSINRMMLDKKIIPFDYNNTFGFAKINDKLIANSYYKNPDSGFEKSLFASEQDCFVFLDQVQQFEMQPEFKQLLTLLPTTSTNKYINQTPITPIETKNIKPETYVFVRTGDVWFIKFRELTIQINDKIGFKYIDILLHSPHKEYSASDLVKLVHKSSPENILSICDPKTANQHLGIEPDDDQDDHCYSNPCNLEYADNKAINEYKQTIKELEEEIEDAEQRGDAEEAEKSKSEIEKIAKHLSTIINKRGKPRYSSNGENDRKSVQITINRAIKHLSKCCSKNKLHHELSNQFIRYLEDTIKTGNTCIYRPKNDVVFE